MCTAWIIGGTNHSRSLHNTRSPVQVLVDVHVKVSPVLWHAGSASALLWLASACNT